MPESRLEISQTQPRVILNHWPVMPPLADTNWPVIHLAFSETNNRTVSAISSPVPIRSAALVIGTRTAAVASIFSPPEFKSVATGPGATALTVMPFDFPNCRVRQHRTLMQMAAETYFQCPRVGQTVYRSLRGTVYRQIL